MNNFQMYQMKQIPQSVIISSIDTCVVETLKSVMANKLFMKPHVVELADVSLMLTRPYNFIYTRQKIFVVFARSFG